MKIHCHVYEKKGQALSTQMEFFIMTSVVVVGTQWGDEDQGKSTVLLPLQYRKE